MLVFKRPIIYVDYKEKIHNIDNGKINILTIEEKFKSIFGNIINSNNLQNLPQLCEQLIIKNNISDQEVEAFAEEYLSNIGSSAHFAAQYLSKKLKSE